MLVLVTSTSDQFCHGKTWQYPRKNVDIATSKCFLFRGNYFVAIATTPNLHRKSDDPFRRYSHALYKGFLKMDIQAVSISTDCRRYIHGLPSLYPRIPIVISTDCRRYIHGLPSLYPRTPVAIATPFRRYIDGG